MEEKNSTASVWNAKVFASNIFQCSRTLPHTSSWGDWIVWTCINWVNVDGWEELKIYEGIGSIKSTSEASMVEGYMVYQTMVYISEYLPKFAAGIHVDRIWDPNCNYKFKGEYLTGKGRLRRVRGNYNIFFVI